MRLSSRLILTAVLAASLSVLVPAQNRPQAERITHGPVTEGTGNSWAVIAWTTDTGGSSVVHYGTDRNRLSQTAEAPYGDNEKTQGQNHRVRISSLQPGTTYYYRVDSGQGEGSGTAAESPILSFVTAGGNPSGEGNRGASGSSRPGALAIINGPVVESARENSAVIAWTTNSGGSTLLRYGTAADSLTKTAESPYADKEGVNNQTHRVMLRNLQPGTKYYYVADSGQGEGTGTEARSPVLSFVTSGGNPSAQDLPSKVPLYRLVSATGDHFYTTAQAEASLSRSYKLDGIAGYLLSAPFPGTTALFRLYNPAGKFNSHFYTSNVAERDKAVSNGYRDEGTAGYISTTQMTGTVPLFRLYNPANDDHFYTTNTGERDSAARAGYKDEGLAGYVWSAQQ